MALTPNNFPAAIEEIKQLGAEVEVLQLKIKTLESTLKLEQLKKKGSGQKSSESTTQDKS